MTYPLGDPARHFFMTRSVARMMGLNLAEALHTGELPATAYAGMVTRCRGCALVEACEAWLGRQIPGEADTPPGCCNADLFRGLKRRPAPQQTAPRGSAA